jgi:hypothetical protein
MGLRRWQFFQLRLYTLSDAGNCDRFPPSWKKWLEAFLIEGKMIYSSEIDLMPLLRLHDLWAGIRLEM